ncbi:MAG: insulinase family protein [Alphaproteobacteria bacterium]|nr:insulinase family protein [Alphaproteobacteria bacterium]
MRPLLLLTLSLAACGPKDAPIESAAGSADPRFERPAPLARPAFDLPTPQRATLSNGVAVVLVENHELPVVDLRIVFSSGSWTDPVGKEGLASSAMDMLNEGAGDLDAVGYASALRKLGARVGAGAGLDSASVTLHTLNKHLEPALDLWALALLDPAFDADEWDRVRKQRVQNVAAARTNPNAIAGRVFDRVMFGDTYDGRFETEGSLKAISAADLEAWHADQLVSGNALILAGGDITLEELTPLLEARLADWSGESTRAAPEITVHAPTSTVIHLIDKPGAAQSVIVAGRPVGHRTDPHYDALYVANTIWGGMFMSRLNMNLREDKGYTYGARSRLSNGLAPTIWNASTSVKSDTTADALSEIFGELAAIGDARPLTEDERAYFAGSLVSGYPARFETTDYLLGQQSEVWRYELPADWLESYIPRVEAVTAGQAQVAFLEQVATQPLTVVVVGDLATIRAPIEALGHPVVELDVDGAPVSEPNSD